MGAPVDNQRLASSPATAPSTMRMIVTNPKPAQISALKRSTKNQARVWRNITTAKIRNTPAAAPTPAPLASVLALVVISALASSISSRTSSDAFSETSWTISPRFLSALF